MVKLGCKNAKLFLTEPLVLQRHFLTSCPRASRTPVISKNKLASRFSGMEDKISKGAFAEYLEIDRSEIDDYLEAAGFMEQNYEKIAVDRKKPVIYLY